jgi:hypothetical protein
MDPMNALIYSILAACLLTGLAKAADDSYAIGAYNAGMTETVFVYGPLSGNCDAERLDVVRKAQQIMAPPS